ncbi:uncharacterized protein [Macrobrachium rosenbergii]|uniref:uncharacterized protein n=1 Tax=Macrobrachium rosenbergii TaxID=79674 RepID=UPI0034D7A26C
MIYQRTSTKVITAVGETENFEVSVGLHQGSALSPFLFVLVMDVLSEEIRNEVLRELLYADDLVITAEDEEDLQRRVERSTLSQEEGCEAEVDSKITAALGKWRDVAGVVCDKKMPIKLKVKIYSTVIRPVLIYGSETQALRRKEKFREKMRRRGLSSGRVVSGGSTRTMPHTTRVKEAGDHLDGQQGMKWYITHPTAPDLACDLVPMRKTAPHGNQIPVNRGAEEALKLPEGLLKGL